MNRQERIEVNPLVCHGKPCIKGTRAMVSVIPRQPCGRGIRRGPPAQRPESATGRHPYGPSLIKPSAANPIRALPRCAGPKGGRWSRSISISQTSAPVPRRAFPA